MKIAAKAIMQDVFKMKQKKTFKNKALWSSNITSVLGSVAAICCAGSGTVGCAIACSSTCSTFGLSIFGLSATGFAHWIQEYWVIFFIVSILFFAEAGYRIFYINKTKGINRSKFLFYASLSLSLILFSKLAFFSC